MTGRTASLVPLLAELLRRQPADRAEPGQARRQIDRRPVPHAPRRQQPAQPCRADGRGGAATGDCVAWCRPPAPPQSRAAHHLSASTATAHETDPEGQFGAASGASRRTFGSRRPLAPRAATTGEDGYGAGRPPAAGAAAPWTTPTERLSIGNDTAQRRISRRSPRPRRPQQLTRPRRAVSWPTTAQSQTASSAAACEGSAPAVEFGWNSPRL